MTYKPINIRDILNSKINGPQENIKPIEIMQKTGPPEGTIPIVPAMKVHIDMTSKDTRGNNIRIIADINTQEDLQKFNALYEKHLPKKGLWGLW